MVFWKRDARNMRGVADVKRWMHQWQEKFSPLGIQVIVADVAQSSVLVNVAERTIMLAPSLRVREADRMLNRLRVRWQRRAGAMHNELCFMVSC
jgi:anti-sigma-K factor RskA